MNFKYLLLPRNMSRLWLCKSQMQPKVEVAGFLMLTSTSQHLCKIYEYTQI